MPTVILVVMVGKMIQLDSRMKQEMYRKVVVCPRCGGKGYIETWNDREREYDRVVCATCEGSRVLEKVVTIVFERVGDEVNKRDHK